MKALDLEHHEFRYPSISDKTQGLEKPHYTDSRFKKPQTVFCTDRNKLEDDGFGGDFFPSCSYDYSDRLWERDRGKAKASSDIANSKVTAKDKSGRFLKSCEWYEAYLSAYFSYPVTIDHIVAGVNHSNGHPYAVFGYKKDEVTQ